MILETFILSGKNFYLRRAVEADVVPIVELMINDAIRQPENSSEPD